MVEDFKVIVNFVSFFSIITGVSVTAMLIMHGKGNVPLIQNAIVVTCAEETEHRNAGALKGGWSLRSSFLASAATNSPADVNFHAFVEHQEKWGLGAHYSPADEITPLELLERSRFNSFSKWRQRAWL